MRKPAPQTVLILIGALLQALFLILLRLFDWNHQIPAFLTIFLISFAVYLAAAALSYRQYFEPVRNVSMLIFACAILFRLTLIACPPSLSEDVYRYVWDGRIQAAGHGPYDYAPRAKELESLQNEDYEGIGHKQFFTPYPPFAQNVFHLLARLTSGIVGFKFGFMIFDLILIEMLRRHLRNLSLPPSLLLIYAWHPLAIIEFTTNAHMDIIAISMMFIGIVLMDHQKNAGAGVALAAAILTKYLPVFSLPWLARKGGWRFPLFFAITAGLLILQFYTSDHRMIRGVSYFYQKWWFNDSIFGVLRSLFGSAEPARIAGGAASIAALLFCYLNRYPIHRSLLIVFGTILIFSPVVHPWYVLWIVPLLLFHRNPAWLFFSGWVAMSYLIRHVYPIGVWKPEWWLKFLVYAPFYSILIGNCIFHWFNRRRKIQIAEST